MSFKLKSSTPEWVLNQVNKLNKGLPLREVDNILARITDTISFKTNFYLQLYRCIEEWNIDTLYWTKKIPQEQNDPQNTLNRDPSIFKYISSINFTNIKCLFIAYTDLCSLEPLSWLKIPSVKSVCVSANNITSLKPLVKCSFLNLNFLNLADNRWVINQLNHLSKINLPKVQPNILIGIFSIENQTSNPNQFNHGIINLTHLVKVQSNTVKKILFVKKDRVSKKFETTVTQRFKNPYLFS